MRSQNDKTLLVMVNAQQKKAVEKLAEAAGISVSDTVRAFLPSETQVERLIERTFEKAGKLTVFDIAGA